MGNRLREAEMLGILFEKGYVSGKRNLFVTYAGCVNTAKALCFENSYDVVLLDNNLPGGSGLELVPDILNTNDRAKIILVTAFPSFDNAVQALKNGAYDYVSKPIDFDELQATLASLTEGMLEFADEFRVFTALNGQQAIDVLREKEIDLVVTDLKMPAMDGFQLLAETVGEFPDVPAIVMTAFGTSEIEKKLQQFESYDYLENRSIISFSPPEFAKDLRITRKDIRRELCFPAFFNYCRSSRNPAF